ncbi:butyrophilin-like protein 10 isoform X2 [Embiotoca jacksoni]|uniref:butyrophilin-like protein 10 isoform X2 n=1 Tax=Embiotoca jacksoni TaxID=100190 RepID=UPI0037043333
MKTSPVMKMSPAGLLSLVLCLNLSAGTSGHDVLVVVPEGSEAILPCSPTNKENIVRKLFIWNKDGQKEVFFYDAGIDSTNGRSGQDEQFRGRVFYFPNQLKNSNASIVIRHTTTADSGDYTCSFPRLQPEGQIFTVKLLVGAAPEPTVTNLNETKDWALLQCEVRGAFPEPKVQWRNRAGNILHAEEPKVTERGGRFYVTLQTTVNRTDHYQCVATQEEINHQTHREIFVHLNDQLIESCLGVGASIGFWFSGVVSLAAVQALCFAAASIRRRIKKRSRRRENKNNEPALPLKEPGTEDRNNIEAGSK